MLKVYRRDNYEVVGKNLSAEEVNSFASNLRERHVLFQPFRDDLISDLEAMLFCFRQFTRDLGVRINHRFPSEYGFITTLPRNDFEIVRHDYQHYSQRLNGFTRGPLIYTKRQKSISRLASVLNHELTHYLGFNRYELSQFRTQSGAGRSDIVRRKSGYAVHISHHHYFQQFNEGLAELINQQIQREYWSTHPRLQTYLESGRSSYRLPLVFNGALFNLLARSMESSSSDVLWRFQRGYFDGNIYPLERMRKYLGERNFSFVAHLPKEEWVFVENLRKTDLWQALR